jgi:hypothetical protein
MGDAEDRAAGSATPEPAAPATSPVRVSAELVEQDPPPEQARATDQTRPPLRDRVRRWLGPVAAVVGIGLLVFGGLGFLSASSDHSSRDAADARRRVLHAAQVRAENAQFRIQREADAVASQVEALTSSANALTDASNAITSAFDAATNQNNNGDVSGAQAAYQAQAGAVAALDGKLAAVRQALSQAQQRLQELRAEQRTP